jgi:hypothetical protein
MEKSEQIKKFTELRSEGYSFRDISKIIGKSTRTLVKWNRKYCSVIFEVQANELNAFKQKILEEKKARLENLNLYYTKIKDKLDHSEIIMKYEKMLALLMRVSKSIDDCQKNIILTEISDNLDEDEENETTGEVLEQKGEVFIDKGEENSTPDTLYQEKKLKKLKENG